MIANIYEYSMVLKKRMYKYWEPPTWTERPSRNTPHIEESSGTNHTLLHHKFLCFLSAAVANDWQNYRPLFSGNPVIRALKARNLLVVKYEGPWTFLYVYYFSQGERQWSEWMRNIWLFPELEDPVDDGWSTHTQFPTFLVSSCVVCVVCVYCV
jgi:hypothetical protein